MQFDALVVEHPTLTPRVVDVLGLVRRWRGEVRAAPGGSAWMHHDQFAQRTENLAGHLEAVLLLADHGMHASALALARTALEHHLLDRLLLLADRYEEIVRPEDPALIDEWERDWEERSEPWTNDVVSAERISNGRALRLIRLGHNVIGEDGSVRERISPYWVAMEHYDAFVGHPDQQADTVEPFDDLASRLEWAKRNQALYGGYLRWSSICRNLHLSELVTSRELVQLQVHYRFLSAFTHATQSGFDLHDRPHPGGPPAAHMLSELALLYVGSITLAEVDTWITYAAARPELLAPVGGHVRDLADELRLVTGYFWFLGGHPQPFDRCQEANRLAKALLLAGQRPQVEPDDLAPDDIGYYSDPFDRLRRLHTGEWEMMTGFGFGPMWAAVRW